MRHLGGSFRLAANKHLSYTQRTETIFGNVNEDSESSAVIRYAL